MAIADEGSVTQYVDKIKKQTLPTFAVCLAAFNGTRWLSEQMDSILNQQGVLVTVFVSVDLSSDGTEEWFNQRGLSERRIILLSHGEKFGGAARNFFRIIREVDFSGFDYMCFADQDDIWFSNKLLHAHEVIVSTGADAYSSNVIAFWPDGHQSLIEKSQAQRKWDYLFEAAGPGCTYVIKKELALAIQGLIKNHWDKIQQMGLHDWFSYAFARANNYSWVIDDYVGMNYRQHEKNQIGVNSGWRAFAYRCYKVLNGWGLRQSVLIACLLDLENEPFVKRWSKGSRIGLLWLALHSNQCRRRFRDRWFFAFSCLALFFVGERKK